MVQLTVARRIYGGFGVVVALLVALATLSIVTMSSSRGSLDTYANVGDNAVRVARIKGSVAEMRRNVLAVAARHDQVAENRVRAMQADLRKDLPEALKHTVDPKRRANLEQMQGLFDQYASAFDKVAKLVDNKDQLVTKQMNALGAQARKNLTQIVHTAMTDGDFEAAALAGVAEEALMLTRLNANKFLADPSDELVKEATANVELFVKEAEGLTVRLHNPERKRLAAEAEEDAKKYRDTFGKVAAATKELDTLVFKQMAGYGTEFSRLADETTQSQESFLENLRIQVEQSMDRSTATTWVGVIVALALAIGLSVLIARAIVGPVKGMTDTMTRLAGGDKTVQVPALDNKDEIGDMGRAVQVFKENAIRVEQMTREQEENKRRAEEERRAALHKMADTFEGSVGKVVGTVTSAATELQASAGQMAAAATETSAQATTVAASAQEASANVQTVASASEELASSINEIARQMTRSQAVANRATSEADSTTELVRTLSESVTKIGEIVGLINDIASQTNLLALNATIESARAGEAGKGFAVVANEVKHLAGQTAKATEDIGQQIATVQSRTTDAVNAIASISHVINEISEISATVASAVQQQTAATGEIARNVEQAATGTEEVSTNITSVEQAARESGQAAEQIRESSLDLSKQAEFLNAEVARFLHQVRADKDKMALVEWSDKLACGEASVDTHHKEILGQLNRFYGKMMHGEGADGASDMLAVLNKTIRAHFEDEEAAMAKAGFGELDQHRRAHAGFLDRFATLSAALEAKRPDSIPQFFDFVSAWLPEHIQRDDGAFAAFKQKKRAA